MNKQYKDADHRGIEWTDYTWNPIAGCFHACQWQMPDGAIANCYAEDVAERVAGQAYPQGFEHHYWKPAALRQPTGVKTPSRIFVGSMADVFGHWVEDWQINAVLNVAYEQAPQHSYQFLTKNPRRYLNGWDFRNNCWVGASTPPDFMWNKPLSRAQKERMLRITLETFDTLGATPTKWLSAEPLSWDITPILRDHPYALDWIVIGAASNGSALYPPDEAHVRALVGLCDDLDVPVFFKGNLRSLAWARDHWREAFPLPHPSQLAAGQMEMF